MVVNTFNIQRYFSYILVITFVIIGAYVIMSKPCFIFGDDVQFLINTHSGQPFNVTAGSIGCRPEEGRFFPLAYFHYNILLLFSNSPSDFLHYMLNAIVWCLFLFGGYLLFVELVSKYVKSYNFIACLLVLFLGQRTLEYFACLWTVIHFNYFLILYFCLLFYYYNENGNKFFLFLCILLMAYFSYCLETGFIIPLIIGCVCLYKKEIKLRLLGYSLLAISAIFLLTYLIFIIPHINEIYDSAHGSNVGVLSNALNMINQQKFLLVTIILFIYRLIFVFFYSHKINVYSDTLLLSAITYMLASFVLKLNFPLYYVTTIILTIPSLINVFDDINMYKFNRIYLLFLITLPLYYTFKIPKTITNIYDNHKYNYEKMELFYNYIRNFDCIRWVSYTTLNGRPLSWDKGPMYAHISYYKKDKYCLFDELQNVDYNCLLISTVANNLDSIAININVDSNGLCVEDTIFNYILITKK